MGRERAWRRRHGTYRNLSRGRERVWRRRHGRYGDRSLGRDRVRDDRRARRKRWRRRAAWLERQWWRLRLRFRNGCRRSRRLKLLNDWCRGGRDLRLRGRARRRRWTTRGDRCWTSRWGGRWTNRCGGRWTSRGDRCWTGRGGLRRTHARLGAQCLPNRAPGSGGRTRHVGLGGGLRHRLKALTMTPLPFTFSAPGSSDSK